MPRYDHPQSHFSPQPQYGFTTDDPEPEIRGIRHHSVRIHESDQDHRERYERARKGSTKLFDSLPPVMSGS